MSTAAVEPTEPHNMADETSLTHLKVRGDQLPRVEKRDAHCCVDQLKLNPEIGVCMARPMIEKEGLRSRLRKSGSVQF